MTKKENVIRNFVRSLKKFCSAKFCSSPQTRRQVSAYDPEFEGQSYCPSWAGQNCVPLGRDYDLL